MPTKEKLLEKLFADKAPRNFTAREYISLMEKCNCTEAVGGRGSAIAFIHSPDGRVIIFDAPHGKKGQELTLDNVKKVKDFLVEVGEYTVKEEVEESEEE